MALESRYPPGFRREESDAPGIVLADDGVLYGVRPDGTRFELGEGGGGCAALQCDPGSASLTEDAVLLVGSLEALATTVDSLGSTRGIAGAQLSEDEDDGRGYLYAQNTAALVSGYAGVGVSELDGFSRFELRADRLHFNNGTPIVRPTFDLSSGTVAQLAQMLADLGLIDVVP